MSGVIRKPSDGRERYGTSDEALLRCWKNGMDTYAIAEKFYMTERMVASRLWRIRERLRELQQQQEHS